MQLWLTRFFVGLGRTPADAVTDATTILASLGNPGTARQAILNHLASVGQGDPARTEEIIREWNRTCPTGQRVPDEVTHITLRSEANHNASALHDAVAVSERRLLRALEGTVGHNGGTTLHQRFGPMEQGVADLLNRTRGNARFWAQWVIAAILLLATGLSWYDNSNVARSSAAWDKSTNEMLSAAVTKKAVDEDGNEVTVVIPVGEHVETTVAESMASNLKLGVFDSAIGDTVASRLDTAERHRDTMEVTVNDISATVNGALRKIVKCKVGSKGCSADGTKVRYLRPSSGRAARSVKLRQEALNAKTDLVTAERERREMYSECRGAYKELRGSSCVCRPGFTAADDGRCVRDSS